MQSLLRYLWQRKIHRKKLKKPPEPDHFLGVLVEDAAEISVEIYEIPWWQVKHLREKPEKFNWSKNLLTFAHQLGNNFEMIWSKHIETISNESDVYLVLINTTY